MFHEGKTICAISTPPGVGGIAVIRVSGAEAINICQKIFSRNLKKAESHKALFGTIRDNDTIVDEVVLTLFRSPASFTGEDVIEISCHGSMFIQNKIIELLIQHGAMMASPGEFTLRAFLNGKMDLSQAEAVADLIHSNSETSHELALKQMRGGFSKEIDSLREELINFASLIELELDFSEEDVEFADRTQLNQLITKILEVLSGLIDSFKLGNVMKNGVPVAIVGVPNVGKSTLLNALLNEDRAIVSDIAGTTRDSVEDQINIGGAIYRFIDTAGIRKTADLIESKGIEKTYEKVREAEIVLYLIDAMDETPEISVVFAEEIKKQTEDKELILVVNKVDKCNSELPELENGYNAYDQKIFISAKEKKNIEQIKEALQQYLHKRKNTDAVVVTNQRHYDALKRCDESLRKVLADMNHGVSGDLLAMDIREALHYLGTITGAISTDDLLGNIFANFCIGK